MFSQIVWWIFWPISALFYSAEEMGIEETQISWKWSGLIVLVVVSLYFFYFLYAQ